MTSTADDDSSLPPLLGVSVFHLKQVLLKTKILRGGGRGGGATNNTTPTTGEPLSSSSTIHEIENLQTPSPGGIIRQSSCHTICPIDGRMGSAYVHCLEGASHVGPATHMLSYSWR